MQTTWQETFSHGMFFEKTSCFFYFQSLMEGSWIFVGFLGSFVKNSFRLSIGIFRGKTFFGKKKSFFLGFRATYMDSEKQFGMIVKTSSYVSRGTFGATFFEYVISRKNIFGSWDNIFCLQWKDFGLVVKVAFYVPRQPL